MDDFSDIMNLPHHVSVKRRQMTMAERAAQFSAFAALTGYDEDIDETARLTTTREEMSDDELAELDAAFQKLLDAESHHPTVSVTYFQPDTHKAGGAYLTYTGLFRHCDPAEGILHFMDGTQITIKNISKIEYDT